MLALASPLSVSFAVPPVTFSMLRTVSSATPPTETAASVAVFSVTTTAPVFSA